MGQIKLQIVFPGLTYLHVGDMIEILVPSSERVVESKPGTIKNTENLYDKVLSGNYMIASIKHSLDFNGGKQTYIITAEVVKDALGNPPTYS